MPFELRHRLHQERRLPDRIHVRILPVPRARRRDSLIFLPVPLHARSDQLLDQLHRLHSTLVVGKVRHPIAVFVSPDHLHTVQREHQFQESPRPPDRTLRLQARQHKPRPVVRRVRRQLRNPQKLLPRRRGLLRVQPHLIEHILAVHQHVAHELRAHRQRVDVPVFLDVAREGAVAHLLQHPRFPQIIVQRRQEVPVHEVLKIHVAHVDHIGRDPPRLRHQELPRSATELLKLRSPAPLDNDPRMLRQEEIHLLYPGRTRRVRGRPVRQVP